LHEKAGPELTGPAISSCSGINPDTSTHLAGNPDQYLDMERLTSMKSEQFDLELFQF
jgi:hypothetical protein